MVVGVLVGGLVVSAAACVVWRVRLLNRVCVCVCARGVCGGCTPTCATVCVCVRTVVSAVGVCVFGVVSCGGCCGSVCSAVVKYGWLGWFVGFGLLVERRK